MIISCPTCRELYDDLFRLTYCPHTQFACGSCGRKWCPGPSVATGACPDVVRSPLDDLLEPT